MPVACYTGGMYLKLQVIPKARREHVTRINAEHYQVAVKKEAKHNLANKQALKLLANHLQIEPHRLRIIHGHQDPRKIVHISN